MKKIIITGASGLLGCNAALYGRENGYHISGIHNLETTELYGCSIENVDITDMRKTMDYVREMKPDAIIHCAALTDVDFCEKNPSAAFRINSAGTENLVKAASDAGAMLVYVNTDSVFDGNKGNYSEHDAPNPPNQYALSKLEGEKFVLDYGGGISVRTNLHGHSRSGDKSLSEWMIRNFRAGKKMTLFKDVVFNPLLVNNLSEVLYELAESRLTGILHAGAPDRMSKLAFGELIADIYGFDKSLIVPIGVDEKNFPAKRPRDTSMDVTKAERMLRTKLLPIRDGILRMRALEESGYVKKLRG